MPSSDPSPGSVNLEDRKTGERVPTKDMRQEFARLSATQTRDPALLHRGQDRGDPHSPDAVGEGDGGGDSPNSSRRCRARGSGFARSPAVAVSAAYYAML